VKVHDIAVENEKVRLHVTDNPQRKLNGGGVVKGQVNVADDAHTHVRA
jgi:hypothetical protein